MFTNRFSGVQSLVLLAILALIALTLLAGIALAIDSGSQGAAHDATEVAVNCTPSPTWSRLTDPGEPSPYCPVRPPQY